jgi:hypothetical protein
MEKKDLSQSNKIKVEKLFPIRDQDCIYANIKVFDWHNNSSLGLVYLLLGKEEILMNYCGYGIANKTPFLRLTIKDKESLKLSELIKKIDDYESEVFLVKL